MTRAEQRRNLAGEIVANKPRPSEMITGLYGRLDSSIFQDKSLLKSAFELCRQLAAESSRYGTIISDEASGRLVSLLAKKVMDRAREKQNLPPLPIIFLTGGMSSHTTRQGIRAFLQKNAGRMVRPLIVTEYVESGDSMGDFLEFFTKQNIRPAVAALSIGKDPRDYYWHEIPSKIVYGSIGTAGVSVYARYGSAGVKKILPGPHPSRLKDHYLNEPNEQQEIQSCVNRARQEIALIAEVFSAYLLR